MAGIFLWVVFPYITLTIMIFGILYRFAFRQLTWAAPSTEFLEKKWLNIGSPLFHYGIIFAFIGHLMGIVMPKSVYDFFGVTDEMYHTFGIIGGGFAGLMVVAGLVILFIRKMTLERVRVHSTFADFFALISLMIVAGLGAYLTVVYDIAVVAYAYRVTIGPWFRSLFIFQPQYQLMATIPTIFKIHVLAAFAFFATIPFTRLIHFFSLPVRYPMRAPQQYRSRSEYKHKESLLSPKRD